MADEIEHKLTKGEYVITAREVGAAGTIWLRDAMKIAKDARQQYGTTATEGGHIADLLNGGAE